MTTIDHYTAAIEAAARSNFAFQRNSEDVRPLPSWESRADWLKDTYRREAAESLAAAVGPLLAPVRALHRRVPPPPGNDLQCAECRKPWPCRTTLTLDVIEAGVTSDGGQS